MKKIALSLLITIAAVIPGNAYTPIIYINGLSHNVGFPYGLSKTQAFMDDKESSLAPSFHINNTTLGVQADNNNFNHSALITTFLYNQKLDALVPGLFFQAHLPIAIVSNKLREEYDYNVFTQKSGLADLILVAGYKAVVNEDCSVTVTGDVIIPVQNVEHKQKMIQSPTMGNGGHTALGLCLSGEVALVGEATHGLKLATETQYHYQGDAKRQNLFSLTSAAQNIREVTVEGGSLLDLASTLMYTYKQFFLDAGISYQFKTERTLIVTDDIALDSSSSRKVLNGKTISLEKCTGTCPLKINNSTATMPSTKLFKFHADYGFARKEFDAPLFFDIPMSAYMSLGITTTIYAKNHPNVWDINIKSGVTF